MHPLEWSRIDADQIGIVDGRSFLQRRRLFGGPDATPLIVLANEEYIAPIEAVIVSETPENVRFWHKADMPTHLVNVSFWG